MPQDCINKYNLKYFVNDNGWVYFEILNGVYGLPQSGALAQTLLEKRLTVHNYYQCPLTLRIWRHTWRPIIFCLLVDEFGIEYVGKQHALQLKQALTEHYKITNNWKGYLYSGINLEWNYDPIHSKCTVRLTMDD